MSDAEFIQRLRERAAAMEYEGYLTVARYLEQAADRIEQLTQGKAP